MFLLSTCIMSFLLQVKVNFNYDLLILFFTATIS